MTASLQLRLLVALSVLCLAVALSMGATLSWDPVTNNVDGTPLTDLAGYRVGWWSPCGTSTVQIVGTSTSVVVGLVKGSNVFRVCAVARDGTASEWSDPVSTNYTTAPSKPGNGRLK